MTAAPRDIDPDAANLGDAGLRRVLALRRMAERGLVNGDPDEKTTAALILDYLERGARGGIEAALGFAGHGWSGALTRYRQERRNAALRVLWRTCWTNLSASAAAAVMAQHWRRVASLRGRAVDARPDDPATTLRDLLDRGHEPLSGRRIREILTCDVGDLHPVETANVIDDFEAKGERHAIRQCKPPSPPRRNPRGQKRRQPRGDG